MSYMEKLRKYAAARHEAAISELTATGCPTLQDVAALKLQGAPR